MSRLPRRRFLRAGSALAGAAILPSAWAGDAEDAETLAGQVFYGGESAGPSAEGWPHIQLLNPAGSGVRAFLDLSWIYQSDTGGAWSIRFMRHDQPLLNPVHPAEKKYGRNALPSGAPSKCEIRYYCTSPQDPLGTEVFQLEGGDGRTNGTKPVEFRRPIILNPGVGYLWCCTAWALLLRASFQWREKIL